MDGESDELTARRCHTRSRIREVRGRKTGMRLTERRRESTPLTKR